MRRVVYWVYLFGLLGLDIAAAQAERLSGYWRGVVEQAPQQRKYLVNIAIDGSSGRIDYPELGCGGELQLIEKSGRIYRYREYLAYGTDRCIDEGIVIVERQGAMLYWRWSGYSISVKGWLIPRYMPNQVVSQYSQCEMDLLADVAMCSQYAKAFDHESCRRAMEAYGRMCRTPCRTFE